ncbi:MAG: hypothetical protein WDN25_03510 [Acetobacteraceae bacterium]
MTTPITGNAMCRWCTRDADDPRSAQRAQVLRLLELLEHPAALSSEQALRLGRRLLATLGPGERLRCEAAGAIAPIDQPARRIMR